MNGRLHKEISFIIGGPASRSGGRAALVKRIKAVMISRSFQSANKITFAMFCFLLFSARPANLCAESAVSSFVVALRIKNPEVTAILVAQKPRRAGRLVGATPVFDATAPDKQ